VDPSARVLSLPVPSAYPCNGVATALQQFHSAAVEGKDWYSEQQFPLRAWSSQAQAFFTGRYSPEDRSNPNLVRASEQSVRPGRPGPRDETYRGVPGQRGHAPGLKEATTITESA
jgi:aryl-alcohol dehydrogenase-like predicted oxidoreductase